MFGTAEICVRCLQWQFALFAVIPFVPMTVVTILLPECIPLSLPPWILVVAVAVILPVWPMLSMPRCRAAPPRIPYDRSEY